MKENIEIVKLDHFGRGIAKCDGKVIFIPNTLIGDVVNVNIVKDKKNFQEGIVIHYVKKMPREMLCPYSNICGGCHLIDMPYQDQVHFKVEKIKEIFKKNLGLEISIDEVITDRNLGYRNKVTFHVKDHRLGFYEEESNTLVELDQCVIAKNEINLLIPKLKELVTIYDIDKIVVRSNQELLLNIEGNMPKDVFIQSFPKVDTLILNNEVVKGTGYIKERILDHDFIISSSSFFQVNKNVCNKMLSKVRGYLQDKKYHNGLDLYCGVGVIGITLSSYVDQVTGIEVVSDAIDNANDNKKINGIDNIQFLCDKVENQIDHFKNVDFIVVDPPRCGLDKKTIQAISKILPKSIVYISCDPNTLVRDLKLLKDYQLEKITIADMFPNTYHVECVCVLNRR